MSFRTCAASTQVKEHPGSAPQASFQSLPTQEWAFLVVQMVKNPPAMQETWVLPMGWEDLLEKEMAIPSIFLPGFSSILA